MTLVASDIMTPKVICIPVDMELREVAKIFAAHQISGAPVVDEAGRPVGVISLANLVHYGVSRDDELTVDPSFYAAVERQVGQVAGRGFQIEDVNSGVARDFMTPIVHSVSESATIDAIARLMMTHHIHRVVVKNGQRVAGIVSSLDVIAGYREMTADTAPRRRRRAG